MEQKIMKNISKPIQSLTCFEPGQEQFKSLENVNFKGVKNPTFVNLPFDENSDLKSEKFDIITMFHVHYYWTKPEKRKIVMQKILQHLEPNGIIIVLILDKGLNQQIELRRETKKYLKFEQPRHYDSVTILGQQLIEELEFEFKSQIPYKVSLPLNMSQAQIEESVTNQLLSYVLSVNFNTLNSQLQDFVINWVKNNCQKDQDEVYIMHQSVSLIQYQK